MKNFSSKISNKINFYSRKEIPFFFVIDFECNNFEVIPLKEINPKKILYNLNGFTNDKKHLIPKSLKKVEIKIFPQDYSLYKKKFDLIQKNLRAGNSYLINLTLKTKIKINCSLKEIYSISKAKYKLFYNDNFTVFSPEIFLKIKNGIVYTFPMKGTIDANIKNAREKILQNDKEMAEHVTIVDLLRNDLNIIAKNIKVDNFRYLDRLKTNNKDLFQVSSIISGKLAKNYKKNLGNIITSMLPAGSVTGAPKKKTVEIIKNTEDYERGFYTGIFGYFDGENLDSSVMIRFIEKEGENFFYKSGGGITLYSDPKLEYQEILDKIYVPID